MSEREPPLDALPAPDSHQVVDDFAHAYALLEQGKLDAYRGQCIAVCNGKVVGNGDEGERLRDAIAKRDGIHPERLAVIYVESGDEPRYS